MSKRKSLIILSIAVLVLIVIINFNKSPRISGDDTKSISITYLPSPPKTITITEISLISDFIHTFNNLSFRRLIFVNEKGWEVKIEFDKPSVKIIIIGNRIKYHNRWFEINESDMNKLKETIKLLYLEN